MPPEGATATRARPTMREVAALAGVSIKTVSRVVNAEAGVSAALVDRVEAAAIQLDYQPDLAASNLRRSARQTATLGLLLEDVSNPFSGTIHRAIEDVAVARGVAVLATSLDEDPQRERKATRAMIRRRVDGLVIVPTGSDQSYLRSQIHAGMALVFVDRPPRFLDADTVLTTNRVGARTAVEHLVEHGHRHIAFLGDLTEIITAADRYEGYLDGLRDSGISPDDRLVRRDLHTVEAADAATEELLRLPPELAPSALFAGQNLITIGTIGALHRHGLQREVALVGFDDIALADLLTPGITVVAQDAYAIGTAAAELIFHRLDGYRGPSQHRTIPTELIVRGSGEIRPRAAQALV